MISSRAISIGLMKELNVLSSAGIVKPEYISPIIRRFQRNGDIDELYSMLLDLPIEEPGNGTDPYEILGDVLDKVQNFKNK